MPLLRLPQHVDFLHPHGSTPNIRKSEEVDAVWQIGEVQLVDTLKVEALHPAAAHSEQLAPQGSVPVV